MAAWHRGVETATTELYSSIISGNVGSDVDFTNGFTNTFHSRGFNLIGTGNALVEFVEAGDKTGVTNAKLGPLTNNGGPTRTHAPQSGSPAINAGNPAAKAGMEGVPQFDQRGEPFSRVAGERIDVGAVESREPSDLFLFVDTLVDELDGNHSIGDFSLREAIAIANELPTNGRIRFAPELSGGTIRLTMGELKITDDVIVEGLGAQKLTIDAVGNDATPDMKDGKGSRIFNIDNNDKASRIEVTIQGLRLTGGDAGPGGGAIFNRENLTILGVTITGNATRENGGGILNDAGTLTLRESTISNNVGQRGAGIYSTGTTVIEHGVISENTSTFQGGGIHHSGGNLTLSDSRVSGNAAVLGGGGVYQINGELSIARCKILENSVTATTIVTREEAASRGSEPARSSSLIVRLLVTRARRTVVGCIFPMQQFNLRVPRSATIRPAASAAE